MHLRPLRLARLALFLVYLPPNTRSKMKLSLDTNWRASWERIPGRCAYLWIYDEFLESDPREGATIVECGVALGKSVAYLANRCLEIGRPDIRVFAVDPWAGTDRNGEQAQMADEVGGDFTLYTKYMRENAPSAYEFVRPLRIGSYEATGMFYGESVDVVCLDGPHSYGFVEGEITAWWPKVRPGGVIGGDDYMTEYQGVIDAVTEHFGKEHEVRTDNEWEWGAWRAFKPKRRTK